MGEENLSGNEKKKGNSMFKKKEIWISGAVGLVLGAAIICLLSILGVPGLGNETIAKYKGGKVTENSLYKEMKKYYPVTYALESIDDAILQDIYELTDEQKKEVEQESKNILETYKQYGYTEETFLKENGFDSKEDFEKVLQLEFRRNLAYIDYLKTLIKTEDIEKYYNENVKTGTIKTQHMLVEISETVNEEQALEVANEIIKKLNEGNKFEDIAKQYNDEGKVIYQDVEINSFNENSYIESYVTASKQLTKDSYTKEAVKTDYGYHVIYCADKSDVPSLEEATNDILEALGSNLEMENQYIREKALIKLREDYNLKFVDEKFEEEYKEYCKEVDGIIE